MVLSTFGKEIYPGREEKITCETVSGQLSDICKGERYRIIYVKEGFGIFKNEDKSQLVTAPSIICLNELETAAFIESTGVIMDILYFHPSYFDENITFGMLHQNAHRLVNDLWFFSPFLQRNDVYIGVRRINSFIGNRIQQLISSANSTLIKQSDWFWPCKSRSFFIELLILANQIYSDEESLNKIFVGKMTEDVREVIRYLHVYYPEKINMESIVKEFHTNKTTLNQKFKKSVGLTVIEYLNNLRMQIACSLLRKTQLSIKEIMDRLGFRDDGHFLRSFKNHTHMSPSVYRTTFSKNQC